MTHFGHRELMAAGRQFKLKDRASGRTSRHPNLTTVALDDRPANGKTHTHTASFGREHWFEDTIGTGWINSTSRIFNRDTYTVVAQSRHPDRVGECPLSGAKRTVAPAENNPNQIVLVGSTLVLVIAHDGDDRRVGA
jgi:hypothetical protein